jgi:excinuclease ABC subunit C
MPISKISITSDQKNLLQQLTGVKILSKPVFDTESNNVIKELLESSTINSLHYLERNRLGHKLNIFDQNSLFTSVVELGKFLQLPRTPRRIECYDISHLQGTKVYGSMVSFVDGVSTPKWYRLFKCKEQNNDFQNHAEVMRRRLKKALEYEELTKYNPTGIKLDRAWSLPDLIIVDGGKGQLSSDYEVLKELGLENKVSMVSLAKAQEEIFAPDMSVYDVYTKGNQGGLLLKGSVLFLVQRIRDEAHRFAIKNNRNARLDLATKTVLNQISGIGPKTEKTILQTFGSVQNALNTIYTNPQLATEKLGKGVVTRLTEFFGDKK